MASKTHDYLYAEPVGWYKAAPHKRRPGKQSNLRRPRTSGPSSECVSYKLDENGQPIEAHVFKPARVSTIERSKQYRDAAKDALAERAAKRDYLLSLLPSNADVD
jgi:hypothetical protein